MPQLRLDKFLANETSMSRKEVKEALKKGKILVNQEPAKKPELKIDPQTDKIFYEGNLISYAPLVYYMLHKPAGCVSATQDNYDQTVLSFFSKEEQGKGIFPVGRLDKDTEGLLLITNDGELAHNLLSPKKHVDKIYYVETDSLPNNEKLNQLEAGVIIEQDKLTLPAKIQILTKEEALQSCLYSHQQINPLTKSYFLLTIREGKFHQVKRMFHAIGSEVTYLKRIQMGSLSLDSSLLPGQFRPLTKKELTNIMDTRKDNNNA